MNLRIFLTLVLAAIITLGLLFVSPMMLGQSVAAIEGEGVPPVSTAGLLRIPSVGYVQPGAYTVTLAESAFAAVDNDPKFASINKDNVTASMAEATREVQAQVTTELQLEHEYQVEIGTVVSDYVDKYNGTINGSPMDESAPLPEQQAQAFFPMSHALRGFIVNGVDNATIFLGDPGIETVEPMQVAFEKTQYLPTGINRMDVDRATTASYRPDFKETKLNIDVAVIDSPVAANLPDLTVVQRANFVTCNTSTCTKFPQDDSKGGYHGTHVAGSVAARDNLGGVVGGAQGARIWSAFVCAMNPQTLGSGGCYNISAAIDWVTANAGSIDTATASLGCGVPDFSTQSCTMGNAMQTAITNMINAGIPFTLASGNEYRSADNLWCGELPSAGICVGALYDSDGKCGGLGPGRTFTSGDRSFTVRDDQRAPFSNYGSEVDVMAPGVAILSTYPVNYPSSEAIKSQYPFIGGHVNDAYASISGTSMATPNVAGVVALIKLSNPSFTPAQVKSKLLADAYEQNEPCDGFGKGGLVVDNAADSSDIVYAQPD